MEKNNLILGVDIDNTLLFQISHFVSFIRESVDSSFSFSDWLHWDILELFPDNKKSIIDFMRKYYSRENIPKMHLMDYAADFLSNFDKKNIYYITARSFWLFKDPLSESAELLRTANLPYSDGNLILQRDTSTKIKKCKSLIAKEKGINLFIEDNPNNALKISKYCPVLLIDYPFNRNIKQDNIIRLGRFDDKKGDWEKNPWQHAIELLNSGEIDALTSPSK